MKIAAVVVSWNARACLEECLASLYRDAAGLDLEVLVVDNASRDGSAEMVAASFPRASLIRNDRNLGFAAANNIALRRILAAGTAEFVLLLNEDVVLGGGAVERLALAIREEPGAGAASPALVLPGGRYQTGVGGALPTVVSGLGYFLFLSRFLLPRTRSLFVHQPPFVRRGRTVRLEWLSGACLLLRREAFEKAGLLDEAYFFGLEDLAFGRRMKAAGLAMLYVPAVAVTHRHGVSHRLVLRRVNTEWLGRLFEDVRRERGRFAGAIFRAEAAAGFFLRLLGRTLAAPFDRRAGRGEKLREAAAFFTFSLTGRGNHVINPGEEPG